MEEGRKKDLIKKMQYTKFFPIVLFVAIISIALLVNYLVNSYSKYLLVDNSGYMLSNNEVSNVLNKDDLTKYDRELNVTNIHENSYIYRLPLDKYTNDNKEIVDVDYPLFVNDGLSIVNYNEDVNLIDYELNRTVGLENQVLSYGRIYELSNYEPIDKIDYLLLGYSNNVYINLFDLNIKTNVNEYVIPVNSLLFFLNDKINYYERTNDTFVLKQIIDIDYDSILSFYYESNGIEYKYRYEDFLIGLGKIHKKEEIIIPPKPIIKEEEQIEVVDNTDTTPTYNDNPVVIPPKEDPFVWIKPSVTCTRMSPNVYSVEGSITINDPAGVIVKAPSFTFVYKEKTYSRRSFYSSGDFVVSGLRPESVFDVVGQYTYLDEDLKTKKIVTFYSDTFTTKSMDALEPISIDFKIGDVYPKKIELDTLKIISDLKSETLRGVRSVAFTIDGDNFYLPNQTVNNLINGKTLEKVSTGDNLASNREYDFEISIYDTVGNKLKVLNSTGKSRTSKKYPTVVAKIIENEIDYVLLGIDLKNDDNVEISDYRYVITNTSGRVMQQGMVESNRIKVEDLDPNQVFYVQFFATFDLNDGKGIKKDYELTSLEFASLPITSLGFLNINIEEEEITSSDVTLNYNINIKKTDERLIKLVKEINFELYDITNDKIVKTFRMSNIDLDRFKKLESIKLNLTNLDSNTKYTLNISSIVQQGETIYNLECLHNLEFFETHKKKPIVDMESSFVTNDMIDFDVKIIDVDAAIMSSKVRVELRDATNKLVVSKRIGINEEFERITYKYLTPNTTYFIIFIADEYNETNNNSTFKARYELARVEKYTEDGISGRIELDSAVRIANGDNLADLESETKWIQTTNYYTIPKVLDSSGSMHIYSKTGSSAYTYDLSDYHGEYVTATFKIRAINKQAEKVYFCNYISGTTSTSYGLLLDRVNTETWTSYSYSFIVGSYKSGNHFIPNRGLYRNRFYTDFVGFYINTGKEVASEYEIKDFEIHRIKDKVEVNLDNYYLEKGTYNSNGTDNNTATYWDNRIRVSDGIPLEGGQVYNFTFSSDTNYQAYIYFVNINTGKYMSAYGWFDNDRTIFVPKDSKTYIQFRYYNGNLNINPGDIDLKIYQFLDREEINVGKYTYDFVTTIKVNVQDLHNEISNDTYYIRVSDDKNNELYVNDYRELVDIDKIIDSYKNLDLEENKKYHVTLFIKIRDREYELDYFDIETDRETVGVKDVNDWALMQPNGNYIILNDLDFKGFTLQTLGWGYRYFYGKIDFQGHSATLYSYDNFQRIGRVEKTGIIKNLVLNVHLDNDVNKNSIRGFVANNYGTIENVIVNIYDERSTHFNELYFNTLADVNRVTARISNFVINMKTKVDLYWDSALLVRENYGIIENGYVYGENAYVTNDRSGASSRAVSLIQRYGGVKSVVRNAFVLSSIEFPGTFSYDFTGLIAHETYGTVENVYTTGNVSTLKPEVGPIVGYLRATAEYKNAYYLNDFVYTSLNQNKINEVTISDLSFQKNVLKSGFNIEEMIELGYYPQVEFTYEKMPKQDYIPLPHSDDDNEIDILNIEVESQTSDTAVVNLTILNEYGDNIEDITISNLDTEIISQSFEDSKSYVKIRVSNPDTYVSKYEIRSIVSKSYNGYVSTRRYSVGDKYLYVDMYREIYNIEDWMKINSFLNQNFIIKNDLDFMEYSNYYINNYTGKLNGDNHVLKNISIVSNKSGLFNQMNGTLENIYFENIRKDSNTTYCGLVGSSNQYGKYNNVHLKNVNIIIPSTRTSNTIYAGALVGYISYSKIINSSVTNVTITSDALIGDMQFGGMVGYSSAGSLSNTYATNVNIVVQNAVSTNGVGGLLGREGSSVGTIYSSYTTGNIYTNGRSAGGIVGNTAGIVENTYSIVNIISELSDVGGIVGKASTVANINSNLFIGNVSSKLINTSIYRIIGSGIAPESNYALDSLLINGFQSDINHGETFISLTDLMNPNKYEDDNGLQLGESFDYSQVSQGIIPKLYYMDTEDLLPNQEDIYFYKDAIEISDLVIDKHADFANVLFYFDNPNHYIIDDIVIDDMDVTVTQNSYSEGISIVTIKAVPLKYFDSYYVREVKYHIGESDQLSSKKMIFLEMAFYKELRTIEDWQNVSNKVAENYLLINDIDFTGLPFNRDVVFNRLETISETETHSLIGMSYTHNASKADLNIIKKVITSIKNINFVDVNIKFTQTSNNDYVNIIDYAYGEMKNITFDNVTIDAPYKNRVAMVGRAYTNVIDNIKLNNITLSGRSYVGGFLAYYENKDDLIISNIEATNIDITATNNYVGGLFTNFSNGSSDNVLNIHDVSISDSNISAPNSQYVGGVGAYAGSSNVQVTNINVVGKEYVGGVFGYANGYTLKNINISDSTIKGSYRYIGGIAGQIRNYMYDSFVSNVTVEGTSFDTFGVGGFFGYHNYYTVSRNGIVNSTIINNGDGTGGLVGYMTNGTISVNSVDNLIINGNKYVGGLIGDFRGGAVINCRVTNSTINAVNSAAGGILGYDDNSVTGLSFYEGYIRQTLVLNNTITSNTSAGGFVGVKNETLYYPQNNYELYSDSTVSATNEGSAHPAVGDSSDKEFINLPRMGFYQNALVNGNPIKNSVTEPVIMDNNLITGIYDGFINESTGVTEINYYYPLASYTNFIKLDKGKTYHLTAENKAVSQSDIFRVRFYDENYNYVGNVSSSGNTWNYFGDYYSLSNLREVYFTPIKDMYIRVLYLYEIKETELKEVKGEYVSKYASKLLTENQLRNRLTWNRYMSTDLQDFYYYTFFGLDQNIWDFSTLDSETSNVTILDKSGNNHNAKASFTALDDDGIFVGGNRDEIEVNNFTPSSNITIHTTFTSFSGRSYQYLFSYRDPSVNSGVGLFLHGRTLYGMINGSNYNTSYTIPIYKEVDVTLTYENNNILKIYVNDELIYTNSNVKKTIITKPNAKTYIGNDAVYSGSYKFLGIIKKMVVYNRAIPASEVISNYYHSYGISNNTGVQLNYDFTTVEYDSPGYYPVLFEALGQADVLLPTKRTDTSSPSGSPKLTSSTPIFNDQLEGNYHIYSSGIDTINIEFDKISNDLSFTYKIGDKEKNIKVTQRVYTLYYDYQSDIEFIINNTFETVNKKYHASDLAKTISVYNDKYYNINNHKLYVNDKVLKEKALHMYKNLVLLEDNKVYCLETDSETVLYNNDNLIVRTIPLYQSTINDTLVSTYYNYSEITDEDGNVSINDHQVIYKNGYVYMVNNKNKLDLLVNNYNGNEYQVVLGLNNELYSYKESLDLNRSFINKNIKEIAFDFNSDLPIIMIKYYNNQVLVLNYYNGELLYNNGIKQNLSLSDFIGLSLRNNDISNNNNSYDLNNDILESLNNLTDEEIINLLDKAKKKNTPPKNTTSVIDEEGEAVRLQNDVNNKYFVSYNEKTEEYEIYNIEDVLNGDISINSKIKSSNVLYNYFLNRVGINEFLKDNRVIIYLAIIITIIINLIYWGVKARKRVIVSEK